MTGCATNEALQQAAAERTGKAEASARAAEQPEECRRDWPLLGRADLVGRDRLTGIARYEDYITGTINPSKRRCWSFNEDIRTGLAGGK